jgi:molybdopterin molybdotransferase
MEMITFNKALEFVMASVRGTGTEKIPFTESLNRVIACDILSDIDLPPFNKATVDGFACRREDLGSEMELLETIAAGDRPSEKVVRNTCSRIMTGAPLPEGSDMVFMVEDSALSDKGRVLFTGSHSKDNISYAGEDARCGESLIAYGTLIKPQHIALMATAGCSTVEVNRRPLVGVISSGDELVEPDIKPGFAQIRNSNAYQIMAQVENAGARGKYFGIVRDQREPIRQTLHQAISECDIVIISGGVSMGDFDFIPAVMQDLGVRILFDSIRIQPGKPTTFGVHPNALVFGLPGNPVSSFVQFELLVRPLICKMMGYSYKPVSSHLPLSSDFTRRNSGRLGVFPVALNVDNEVYVVEYHGSGHISALAGAFGLIEISIGQEAIKKGELVNVRQI